jgi:hypothetical protein
MCTRAVRFDVRLVELIKRCGLTRYIWARSIANFLQDHNTTENPSLSLKARTWSHQHQITDSEDADNGCRICANDRLFLFLYESLRAFVLKP